MGLKTRTQEVRSLLEALEADLSLADRINAACHLLCTALRARLPVLVCGNGGSASDAQHIAGELVGRYLHERPAYNVLALSSNTSVITAWANDYSYETIFSRQVEAHGQPQGVLWALSTSGNSTNVLKAMNAAKSLDMQTLAMTGRGGGKMAALSDILIDIPSNSTPRIQEMHLVVYHLICEQVERELKNN